MTHIKIDLTGHALTRNRTRHYITRRKLCQLVISRHETLTRSIAQIGSLTT